MREHTAVVGQSAVLARRRRRSTDLFHPRVFEGDPTVRRLTTQENRIALLIGQGLADYSIAKRLGLSPSTVKTCRQRIRQRLQLANRAEIVAWVAARTSNTDPGRLHRVGDRIGMKTDSRDATAHSEPA